LDVKTQYALNCLKAASSKAVEELIKLTGSAAVNIRLRACQTILDYTLKALEAEDIEGRLEEIERVVLERRKNK